jgi:hypothetical protein
MLSKYLLGETSFPTGNLAYLQTQHALIEKLGTTPEIEVKLMYQVLREGIVEPYGNYLREMNFAVSPSAEGSVKAIPCAVPDDRSNPLPWGKIGTCLTGQTVELSSATGNTIEVGTISPYSGPIGLFLSDQLRGVLWKDISTIYRTGTKHNPQAPRRH